LKIFEATEDHLEDISDFFKEAWKEAGPDALGWTGASEETISEISSTTFLSELLNREDTWIFISRVENIVVGFASTRTVKTGLIELSGVIIRESWTGKGVGRELLDYVISSSRKYGFTEMVVKTEVTNERAIGFYKSMGFIESGVVTENITSSKVQLKLLKLIL
jgi:ribosomal protein S18 acetylase RimI-like enzyme